ncbi:MarR family winged helix-turn-helix transcriptional regulator [Devosia nitrariae]|uniref:MarR family transcriptional regulator n=1 Tax=Devosia nitrariae TaxID=2071872 RepID=A0ABQ5W695_9HYPH|nr:MarR family winged helix-turn-helix transcriptional regulator [Devosia nitrariae]GLQ55384.1 MarR family transcriptional regulator [Devosia nitrariae]
MTDTGTARETKKARKRFRTDSVTGIVGYRLRRAQLAVFQRFQLRFAEFDLRPADYSVLALIADNPGCKQIEIANALRIKRANFVALINRLEARGLTERREAVGDRRSQALYLTPVGSETMQALKATQDAFEAECIEKLGGVEARDVFLDLLDRLADETP